MPVSSAHGKGKREREAAHRVDRVRNDAAHGHGGSQQSSDSCHERRLVKIPVVEERCLPDSLVRLLVTALEHLQVISREGLKIALMEQRVRIARAHDEVVHIAVADALEQVTHSIAEAPVGICSLRRKETEPQQSEKLLFKKNSEQLK